MTRCNCPQCRPIADSCPAADELAKLTAELSVAKQLAYDESDLRGQMESRCVALIDERDTLLAHLERQRANLRAAWDARDRLETALRNLLPFVTGPEDEESPGFSEAVTAAQDALRSAAEQPGQKNPEKNR